jgi:serine/threonine protein kinase
MPAGSPDQVTHHPNRIPRILAYSRRLVKPRRFFIATKRGAPMPQPDTIGPYQLIEEIGRGGFVTVYRARDKMSREVAQKVIRTHHAVDADFIERFRQEAQTAAGLRHDRLIHIYDFDEFDGQLYLAMELIPGPSLRRLLTERGPLPEAAAAQG